MSNNINKTAIKKLLKTVDAGLCCGLGDPVPGEMCVEAAVCYALGLPHGDAPECVGWAVRYRVIRINDGDWSSNEARAAGMRRLAVAQLGSDQLDQNRFAELVALKAIKKLCPLLFSELAKLAKTDEDRKAMEDAGLACADVTSLQEAVPVLVSAYGRALYIDFDRAQSLTSAYDLARAQYQDLGVAQYLNRGRSLSLTLDHGLDQDESLAMLAAICVETLIEMESPGCQWLGLCEIKEAA